MFGAILKATNSSFQKGMTFCRSIYVKKVIKLLAFIFEQPSYYEGARNSVRGFAICTFESHQNTAQIKTKLPCGDCFL